MTFRLKNRHECPPNGFIVRVKEIDIERQFWSFSEAVKFFVNLAESNPQLKLPTSPAVAAEIVDEMNAKRCSAISNAEHFYTQMQGEPMKLASDVSSAPAMKQCCGRS